MTEEHRCTEQCIEELEGIVEEMQAERNELSCRVVKLTEALRAVQKQAQSFEMYHLDMGRKPDPWMHQIRNIADTALSGESKKEE